MDRALNRAALKEFVDHGFHAMSMESIAARAGVSKVSLYRRWTSKLAVTAEVLRLLREEVVLEDYGSFEADLRALLTGAITTRASKTGAKVIMRTMGEISGNSKLLALYREYLLAPRLGQIRALVLRARARGELRQGVPVDLAVGVIVGPLFVYYLTLLAELEVEVGDDIVEQLTLAILRALGT